MAISFLANHRREIVGKSGAVKFDKASVVPKMFNAANVASAVPEQPQGSSSSVVVGEDAVEGVERVGSQQLRGFATSLESEADQKDAGGDQENCLKTPDGAQEAARSGLSSGARGPRHEKGGAWEEARTGYLGGRVRYLQRRIHRGSLRREVQLQLQECRAEKEDLC